MRKSPSEKYTATYYDNLVVIELMNNDIVKI